MNRITEILQYFEKKKKNIFIWLFMIPWYSFKVDGKKNPHNGMFLYKN